MSPIIRECERQMMGLKNRRKNPCCDGKAGWRIIEISREIPGKGN